MLGRLTRSALRRGLIGGSQPWLVIGATLLGVRIVRAAASGRPERVYRAELGPNETLRITSRRIP
jgi:hypothetical protein